MEELTRMLHAAYRELGEAGLNFSAVDQTVERTRRRAGKGPTFVAVEEATGSLIGTITLNLALDEDDPPLYLRSDCASFGQFGVHPDWRGLGIGRALHDQVVAAAIENKLRWLALDTAMPARHLIQLYEKWGYEVVGEHHWGGRTSYTSVLMWMDLAIGATQPPSLRPEGGSGLHDGDLGGSGSDGGDSLGGGSD